MFSKSEAQKIIRLCETAEPAALAELNRLALRAGLVTPAADAATVISRMRKAADAI